MSKIRDEGLLRLQNRVERLTRLLKLEAPDPILAREGFLIMEAAQMLSPESWLTMERDRLNTVHKRAMRLCDEPDCEELVAWEPHATSGAPPGPFHMTACEKHALETEQQLAEEDKIDDEGAS